MQIKFDRIQAGSLPPKFTYVNAEAGARDNMVRFFSFEIFKERFSKFTVYLKGQAKCN